MHTVQANQAVLAAKLTKKRSDLKFKALRACPNRASVDDLVEGGIGFDLALGKILISRILDELRLRNHPVGELTVASHALEDLKLKEFIGIVEE